MSDINKKAVYKAVRNYMANELGLDRSEVEKILREQIQARNPGQLVKEAVAAYFHTGRDAYRAGEYVQDEIRSSVRAEVRRLIEKDASGHVSLLVQDTVDRLYAAAGEPLDGQARAAVPGMEPRSRAALVTKELAVKAIRDAVGDGYDVELAVSRNPADLSPFARLSPITRENEKASLDAVRPYLKDPAAPPAEWAGRMTLDGHALANILSEQLTGWKVADMAWYGDRLLLLGRPCVRPAEETEVGHGC